MLKKIIIICLCLIPLVIGGISLFLYFNKDFIKSNAISSLNNELNAKVDVNGIIDITFIETFPSINLKLTDVLIEDNLRNEDTLAQLETIYLSINPFSILNKDYTIDDIKLIQGFIHLYIDKKGNQNFNILKTKNDSTSKSTLLNLERIKLVDIELEYNDLQNNILIQNHIANAKIAGVFEQKNFKIDIDLNNILTNTFILNKTHLLTKKNVSGEVHIEYNNENNTYQFGDSHIKIAQNNAKLDGEFSADKNTLNLQVEIAGNSLKDALTLVPNKWINIQNYSGNGSYNALAKIYGKANDLNIDANFSLKNGTLKLKNENILLTDVNLNGSYTNTKTKSGSLVLDMFSFTTINSQFDGRLSYPDLNKIAIQTQLKATINHTLLNTYLYEHFKINNGEIKIENLIIDLAQKKNKVWQINKVNGEIVLKNIEGKALKINLPIQFNGTLKGTKNYLSAFDLKAFFGKNDLQFDGEIKNLLELIINKEISESIGVNGRLISSYFNLNDFLNINAPTAHKSADKKLTIPNLDGKLNIQIDTFTYQKLQLNKLKIKAAAKNKTYTFDIHKTKTLNGTFKGKIVSNMINNNLEINMNGKINNIDIKQMFTAFDDFGLEDLKSTNINGRLSSNFSFSALWENFNTFNTKTFVLNSNVSLKNGELHNFKPLKSLSGKLDIEQLTHLRFDDLQTNISISKGVIELASTTIKSSLLTLDASGTHTFDNEIDYKLVLNLKNLLAAKFKKKQQSEENYINDTKGGINIFINIGGTMDNPIVKYDKESVRKKIKQDFKQEKDEFKNLFKKNEKSEFEENNEEFEEIENEEYIEWE